MQSFRGAVPTSVPHEVGATESSYYIKLPSVKSLQLISPTPTCRVGLVSRNVMRRLLYLSVV